MATLYNLTNVTEARNILEMTQAVNQLSGGILGTSLLFVIFILSLIVFKRDEYDTKRLFITASSITTVFAVLFGSVNLIEWWKMIFPLLILIGTLIYYKLTE